MKPKIIDRGRGPEIEGTRITVYAVMDYLKAETPIEEIPKWMLVTVEQIEAEFEH